MFIRVRGATPGDPLHEFDVSVDECERNADLYEVIDTMQVPRARPASHIPGVVPDPQEEPAPKPRTKRASKTGEDTAPSAGLNPEEKNE
ncbi:hypothetical protein CQ047_17830 [Microbacterium sp. MYb72]|nr:hypothetical protein CQ047_17830 [Microbacterium sp. MYb72]